nr:hypothetical protein [Rhodococcus sp. HNM0569]
MDVVQLGFPRAYYGVVAVDHEGADLTIHNARGEVVDSETVTGDQYPIHKARSADTDQWGDAENRTDEARKRNIAEVADRVTKRLDAATADGSKVAPFFVIGEVRARSQLLSALPERARAVSFELERGSRAAGAKTVEVRTAIDEEITVRRAGVVGDAADRWNAEKGRASGLAVEGIADVTRALREQAVDTLIVGDVGERTVVVGDEPSWVAPDADTLSEFGASDEEVRLADEALPFAAIAGRSVLIGADPRIEPVDGFAAILRHALP